MSTLDSAALRAASKAVEDHLVQLRDDRVSILGSWARNGFVIREKDGEASEVIRLSTTEGLAIGIKTYLAILEEGRKS